MKQAQPDLVWEIGQTWCGSWARTGGGPRAARNVSASGKLGLGGPCISASPPSRCLVLNETRWFMGSWERFMYFFTWSTVLYHGLHIFCMIRRCSTFGGVMDGQGTIQLQYGLDLSNQGTIKTIWWLGGVLGVKQELYEIHDFILDMVWTARLLLRYFLY